VLLIVVAREVLGEVEWAWQGRLLLIYGDVLVPGAAIQILYAHPTVLALLEILINNILTTGL
jgi:hypothetical protein